MVVIVRKPSLEEEQEMKNCPTWSCEVSEFEWDFEEEEVCLILEGEATVTYNGEAYPFGAGDYVIVPKGMKCHWSVTKPIKKHYKHND